MSIQLNTLGGLQAYRDGVELDRLFTQRSRAALFVYLAVEKQASREAVTAFFWPESSDENARHALRQSLYQLRKTVGEDWVESHPHEVRVRAGVRTDVDAFTAALARGDAEAAARLYRGRFLGGVNLVDSKAWESWVDGRRAQYSREFRKACRDWLEARRASGDPRGAIEAAQLWVYRDPFDDEAQHRLIEALAEAGERAEAIRQYETYVRLLEPEGLRPLDDTIGLAERIRADAAAWPPPRQPSATRSRPGEQELRAAAPPARPRPWRRPLALAAAAFVVLIIALALARAGTRPPGEIPAVAGDAALAVLPFSVRGDEDATYLSEGMVNLLATALDGAGSVRPVDARAVFAMLEQTGHRSLGLRDARRLATQLGAALFVLGDIVQVGDWLQIDAALFDATNPSPPLERAAVSGAADRVFELVDQLAARLLAGLGGSSADRLFRTAALTTVSLPAFRAYLDGEMQIRAGRFERAAEAYLQAIAHDSTFAIAHYRLALARDWAALPGFDEAAGAAVRHAARLSPRDRALLEALQAYHRGDPLDAERRYRAILARYPEDLDAWFQLAEVLFHYGPLRGRPVAESKQAWAKVLSYEPRHHWALVHLGRVAAVGAQVATLDSLLARFAPDEVVDDRRLTQLALLRALTARDTASATSLAQVARGWEDAAVYQLAAYLTAFSPDPAGSRRVVSELIEPHRSRATVAELRWLLSLLHLSNGRLSAGSRARAAAVAEYLAVGSEWHRRVFVHVTEWCVATLPLPLADSTLNRVRRAAASLELSEWRTGGEGVTPTWLGSELWASEFGEPSRVEALRLYTLGMLSLRLQDPSSAEAAAEALGRVAGSATANPFVRNLERGLRAWIARHHGRYEEALRLLEQLELASDLGATNVIPFVARANERWLRGEVLAALGRDDEALGWFGSLAQLSTAESPLRAPAHLRQAEIHERLGNRSEAARHYGRFVELWEGADAELQPVVEQARRKLARLQLSP